MRGRPLLAVAGLAAVLAAGWLYLDVQGFLARPLAVPADGLVVEVAPGTGIGALARELERAGALERPGYLRWLARLEGQATRIHAGEYRIAPGTRPRALLAQLVAGRVIQHRLTVVEGWTFRELAAAVADHDALVHTLPDTAAGTVMAAIGHPDEHPEGRFFPETYHFPRGTTDVAFLRRAYAAMADYVARAWPARDPDLPLADPYEALILASIVERETAVPAERPRIAGVFVRRLRRGMPLQTDPTVIYGLGDDFDGNLRRRDLRRDTPYNTYTRRGLPPTPIALPGGAAIDAALHPADGEALYFVSRGDGSHVFSRTLAEHNKAVARYQLGRGKSD